MAYNGGAYGGPGVQRPAPQRHYPLADSQQYTGPPQQYDQYADEYGYGYENGYDPAYGDQYYGANQNYAPPQQEYYGPSRVGPGGPSMSRGGAGPMRPPPGDGGRGGPYPPRGGGGGIGPPGGRPKPPQGRGGRPGIGLEGNSDPSDRRPQMNGQGLGPASPAGAGFGGSPFPTFPGQKRRTDLDQEHEITAQMGGIDLNGDARPPPRSHSKQDHHKGAHGGRGQGQGPMGPPHPRGPPQQYPVQDYPDQRRGPPPGPAYGPPMDAYNNDQGYGQPERSMTMPSRDHMDMRPGPPPMPRGMGPGMPPPRPSTAQGMRPQRGYPPNNGASPPRPFRDAQWDDPALRRPASVDESYNNNYYDGGSGYPPSAVESLGPNFEAIPPARPQPSFPQHAQAGWHGQPQRGPARMPEMGRTKSQPDLRNGQTAVFEMAHDAPPMPALPSHPTPVRAGLMANSVVNIGNKPAPVRNYSGGATQAPTQGGAFGHPANGGSYASAALSPAPGAELPVTVEELEHLRAVVKKDPQDQASALRLAKRLVEAADVLAPNLADPRARSRARDRYLADAQKILKKLANVDNPDAMFFLADSLGRGLFGGEPDNKEAFTLYQAAAKLNHAAAAYRTAVCCEIGNEEGGGTRKDPLKAMQWYKRGCDLGDVPAMYKVGMILLKGLLGQPRNTREAVVYLQRAAERASAENPHALHELGLLYESAQPNDSIVRDEAYAFQLFKQAAALGYKFSQFRLGCAYEYGLMGCPIDPRQSILWYSRAATQAEHQSELALSGWYLTGSDGVLGQSDTEAFLWARKAAQAGLAKAEYAMGYFTEVGIGVPANLEDAKRWYWRAAAQDFPKARERLEDLKRSGKNGPRARERISRSKIGKQQEGECSVM